MKSTHKGKRNGKNGPSSSPVRKIKSVDEVTNVSEMNVPSPTLENPHSLEDEMEEVLMVIPPTMNVGQLHHSVEKVILSGWLNVMKSGLKELRTSRQMSCADDGENYVQLDKQVSNAKNVVVINFEPLRTFKRKLNIGLPPLFVMFLELIHH